MGEIIHFPEQDLEFKGRQVVEHYPHETLAEVIPIREDILVPGRNRVRNVPQGHSDSGNGVRDNQKFFAKIGRVVKHQPHS